MHKRRPPKPMGFFDRAVPTSSKYSHIQATLDSGTTVAKVKVVNTKEISRRRDESFYRIVGSQLAALYNEYEGEHQESLQSKYVPEEGGPLVITYEEEEMPTYERPYLVLDTRDAAEFNRGHLLQARSYPYTMMRRDQAHPEVYNFKNKEGCLIVMYCDDERISSEAAHLLVQRGVDNVYLLTGGLADFAARFPSYFEGKLPPQYEKALITKQRTGSRAGLSTKSTYDSWILCKLFYRFGTYW